MANRPKIFPQSMSILLDSYILSAFCLKINMFLNSNYSYQMSPYAKRYYYLPTPTISTGKGRTGHIGKDNQGHNNEYIDRNGGVIIGFYRQNHRLCHVRLLLHAGKSRLRA